MGLRRKGSGFVSAALAYVRDAGAGEGFELAGVRGGSTGYCVTRSGRDNLAKFSSLDTPNFLVVWRCAVGLTYLRTLTDTECGSLIGSCDGYR